jgi:hypothetical protein
MLVATQLPVHWPGASSVISMHRTSNGGGGYGNHLASRNAVTDGNRVASLVMGGRNKV